MNCNMNGFYNSVKEWLDAGKPLNSFVLGDCMQGMAAMPDKFVNLAIVDPPYGQGNKIQLHEYITWNDKPPSKEYFFSLRKNSQNQIIWGCNNFNGMIETPGRIVWNKLGPDIGRRNPSFRNSHCELASQTFDRQIKMFSYTWIGNVRGNDYRVHWNKKTLHPCEKPIALYLWLLQNYATPGDIILDTHVGSASSLIACEQMGFQYIGFEIDSDYFRDACNRIIQARKLLQQNEIFQREEVYNGKQHEQNELF